MSPTPPPSSSEGFTAKPANAYTLWLHDLLPAVLGDAGRWPRRVLRELWPMLRRMGCEGLSKRDRRAELRAHEQRLRDYEAKQREQG